MSVRSASGKAFRWGSSLVKHEILGKPYKCTECEERPLTAATTSLSTRGSTGNALQMQGVWKGLYLRLRALSSMSAFTRGLSLWVSGVWEGLQSRPPADTASENPHTGRSL